jgi:glycosyltransferase involved in cell wall biosynthesis
MRIMIAASVSPFSGREELHWARAIRRGLSDKKNEVELFMLPIVHNPLLIPEQMTALRFIDIKDSSDVLLTIGFPAFVLKHANKRVLLFSLASSLHEHFDTEFGILATPQYQRIRGAVQNAEKKCLLEAKRIICTSKTMATQLMTDLNIRSTSLILDDSAEDQEAEHLPENGSWIVCESMLEPAERIDLLLSAVSLSLQNWRLLIFVPSSSEVYRHALDTRIERMAIQGRVEVKEGHLTVDILKRSIAYIALHFASTRIPESTLRAIKFLTPMVTASDCSALLEIITHDKNGLIVEPTASEIAEALDKIAVDKKLKERLSSGNRFFSDNISGITSVIENLVG